MGMKERMMKGEKEGRRARRRECYVFKLEHLSYDLLLL
jgi:hypothetical protein